MTLYAANPLRFAVLLGSISAIAMLTWYRTPWALLGFAAGIPLVSGFQLIGYMQGVPLLGVGFAAIYLVWLPGKAFFKRGDLRPKTRVGHLVDLLSAIVLLSLAARYCVHPAGVLWQRFWFVPALGVENPLFGIEPAQLMLQGFFFFRVLELEFDVGKLGKKICGVFYVHAGTVGFFAAAHWLRILPPKTPLARIGIHSPFDDAHSFGSYVVLLCFVMLGASVGRSGKGRVPALTAAAALSALLLLSASRASLVALVAGALIWFAFRRAKKAAVAVVLVSAVALAILSSRQVTEIAGENKEWKYLGTLADPTALIQDGPVVNRLELWKRALGLIKDSPLVGSGIGTYYALGPAYQSGEVLKDQKENAHNYYLQLAAELGAPALLVFLAVLYGTFSLGLRQLPGEDRQKGFRQGLMTGLGAYLITMLSGHPLLLANQQFLFWFVLAVVGGAGGTVGPDTTRKRSLPVSGKMLAALVIGLLLVGHGLRIYLAGREGSVRESGFYDYEDWGGESMRWSWKKSVYRSRAESDTFGFKALAAPHNSRSPEGLTVEVRLNGEPWDTLHFLEGGTRLCYYHVPKMQGQEAEIEIRVSRTFNPQAQGLSLDPRDLGVALNPLSYLRIMPRGGVGFYPAEHWGEVSDSCGAAGAPEVIRWTGKRASIRLAEIRGPAPEAVTGKVGLFLRSSHPDVAERPVLLRILADDREVRQVEFADSCWKRVDLAADEWEGARVLTLVVSRTWNPRLAGASADGRDLGVAVGILKDRL